MSRQYLRQLRLTVGARDGKELDLAGLRVSFIVTAATTQTPNAARIQVWNASFKTFEDVRREFTRVTLSAGYPDNIGVIFTGNIRQARFVRQTPVDAFMELSAADGDQAYNGAIVQASLMEGSTARIRLAVLDAAMAPYGLVPGERPDFAALGDRPSPRPVVMHGMARDFYRIEAQNLGLNFFIQDGRIHLVPFGAALPGNAFVLNAQTGLIGWPEQTEFGILANCLLNPRIRVGTEVQINNREMARINEQQVDLANRALNQATGLAGGGSAGQVGAPMVPIRDDGRYTVRNCTYRGDTHGGEASPWFCEMTLQGVDNPNTQAFTRSGVLPAGMQP